VDLNLKKESDEVAVTVEASVRHSTQGSVRRFYPVIFRVKSGCTVEGNVFQRVLELEDGMLAW